MKNVESSTHFTIRSRSLDAQLKALSQGADVPISVADFGEYLPPIVDQNFGKLPQFIRDYVQAPTLAFEAGVSHTLRREFATYLQANPDVLSWYESNRLRYNHLMGLTLLPYIYEEELRSFQPVAEILTIASASVPPSTLDYDNLPLEERIAITKEIAYYLKNAYLRLQAQNQLPQEV